MSPVDIENKEKPFEQKTRRAGTREERKQRKNKERKEGTNETNHEQCRGGCKYIFIVR